MTIKQQLTELFKEHRELTVKEMVELTDASKQMVHIVLNQLLSENFIEKLGRTPKTLYRIKGIEKSPFAEKEPIDDEHADFLKQHFLLITEVGEFVEGTEAFRIWCNSRNLPFGKTANEFIQTRKKYLSYFDKKGFIDGTQKLINTDGYEQIHLDQLLYLDFYAIERFGKTRLGVLLHFAKQGQNKMLMGKMLNEIREQIVNYVNDSTVDAVGFVPATIRREVQLMKFLQQRLKISLPEIDIKKVSGIIPVPQKSLSKLPERIRNAENTFSVVDSRRFEHVLLIDDAVGSGSTMNQIAGKLKLKGIAKKITGLAVVGSFKGFDVITDV